MKKVILGTDAGTQTDLAIDLQRLIQTRMLVTAQSGAGTAGIARHRKKESEGERKQV